MVTLTLHTSESLTPVSFAHSHQMALNPQSFLQPRPPALTADPQHRHPHQRTAAWTTWTSWGKPLCNRHCPRKPSKCGGESCHCQGPPCLSPRDSSFWAQQGIAHYL